MKVGQMRENETGEAHSGGFKKGRDSFQNEMRSAKWLLVQYSRAAAGKYHNPDHVWSILKSRLFTTITH